MLFSFTLILCEVKFEYSRSAKSAIFTHLGLWILIFMNFFIFWRLKFTKSTKFRAPKMAKTAILELLNFQNLISRKIWLIEKSWNFHTVVWTNVWLVKTPIFSSCPTLTPLTLFQSPHVLMTILHFHYSLQNPSLIFFPKRI